MDDAANPLYLRRLTTSDAARCAELDRLLFADDGAWPKRVFVEDISQPHVRYWGVVDCQSDQVVGYLGFGVYGIGFDISGTIHVIGVDPQCHRRGVATTLMDAAMKYADERHMEVNLEVRVDNDPAIALYRRYGFEIAGVRKRYYMPSGKDAYTMIRPAQ